MATAFQFRWSSAAVAAGGVLVFASVGVAAPPAPVRLEAPRTLVERTQAAGPSAAFEAERLRAVAEEAARQRQQAVAEEARRQQQAAELAAQQALEAAKRKQAAADAAKAKRAAADAAKRKQATPDAAKAQQVPADAVKRQQAAPVTATTQQFPTDATKRQQPAPITAKANQVPTETAKRPLAAPATATARQPAVADAKRQPATAIAGTVTPAVADKANREPAAAVAASSQPPAPDAGKRQQATPTTATAPQVPADTVQPQQAAANGRGRVSPQERQRRTAEAAAAAIAIAASVVTVPRCAEGSYRNRETGECEPAERRPPPPPGEFVFGRCSARPGTGPDEEQVRSRSGPVRLVRGPLSLSFGDRTRTLVDVYDLPSSIATRRIDGEVLFADAYADVPATSSTCRGETEEGGVLRVIDVSLESGGTAPACIQYCPISPEPAARVTVDPAAGGHPAPGGREKVPTADATPSIEPLLRR